MAIWMWMQFSRVQVVEPWGTVRVTVKSRMRPMKKKWTLWTGTMVENTGARGLS